MGFAVGLLGRMGYTHAKISAAWPPIRERWNTDMKVVIAGGVAGGQIVVLTILLDAFGLPSEAIAVVMAITPFTDPAQTCANIISDMAAAKVVDARARSAARKSGQAYYDAE